MLENLWGWLMAAITPIVKRVLAALGLGWVTMEGVQAFWDSATTGFLSEWNAIPSEVMQFVHMMGFSTAFGIIMGALAVVIALAALRFLGFVEE